MPRSKRLAAGPGTGVAGGTTIRPATLDDLQPMVALFRHEADVALEYDPLLEFHSEANWAAHVEAQFKRTDTRLFVAQRCGAFAGFIQVRIVGSGTKPVLTGSVKRWLRRRIRRDSELVRRRETFGFIDHIFVLPEVRQTPIAFRLLMTGMRWLREHGATEVEGAIWAKNEYIVKMAHNLGFEPVRLLMRKRLQ